MSLCDSKTARLFREYGAVGLKALEWIENWSCF